MSTRLIEDCFIQEELAEQEYTRFITINIHKDTKMIVFDPYMVNSEDIRHVGVAGRIGLVRLRRPAWGRANVNNCIKVIRL